MGFSASVAALLETYDNCISLLKAFKRRDRDNGSRKATKTRDQQALLKHSLKTDRKKVDRAYTSRLSETGSGFEKGDSKSKHALARVLRKLNAAVARLVRLAGKNQDPTLDYQSLMSLSNASRVQAIRAFDQLSRRLGSKSSGGSTSSAAKTARPSESKASKPAMSSASSKGHGRLKKDPRMPRGHEKGSRTRKPVAKGDSKRNGALPGRLQTDVATSLPDPVINSKEDKTSIVPRRPSRFINRFSLISMSSDSTRLGEIPERKWHRRYDPLEGSLDEYNTPVVYPLRPYQPQPKERRFLGLFRRGG